MKVPAAAVSGYWNRKNATIRNVRHGEPGFCKAGNIHADDLRREILGRTPVMVVPAHGNCVLLPVKRKNDGRR